MVVNPVYPNYNDNLCVCVYDSEEKKLNTRTVLHFESGAWFDDLMEILRAEWEEAE